MTQRVTQSGGASSVVVTVGEELLSGETVETNGSWLSKRLASLGIPVTQRQVVGDDRDAIQAAAGENIVAISAGNYGGKLGKYQLKLAELFDES